MAKLIGSTAETLYFSCYSTPGCYEIPADLLRLRDWIGNPPPAITRTLSPKVIPRGDSSPWYFNYEIWEQRPEGVKRRPGQVAFQILPRGMSHFFLVMKNDDMMIQAVRHFAPRYPTVHIQIRAKLIWAVGYQNALQYCKDVATAIFGKFARTILSRVDFTVDIAGWNPTEKKLCDGLVGRPTKLQKHIDADTSVNASYYKKKKFTGIRLGKGKPMMLRIYDKTDEIAVNGTNTWFYEVWKKNGWNENGTVWRVEFQCRRKVLLAFGFGDSVDSLEKFAGMFRYLSTDWVRLTVADAMQRRNDRLKTDPVWELVQGANFGNGGDVTRAAQKLPERKQLIDQFKGLATTIAARHGITTKKKLNQFVAGVLCGEFDEVQLARLKAKKALYDALKLVKAQSEKKGLDLRKQDRLSKKK
jgi:hypothetical protein